MSHSPPLKTLITLWFAWAVIVMGFQHVVTTRFSPARPDEVVMWTATETLADSQNDKPTLIDPFLNALVSWDSEFYLSIALNGYDDPAVRTVEREGTEYALNYAFFPLYPLLIRALSVPLSVLGLTPIATATLAGVIITQLATLVAIVALYDLAQPHLGEDGALRTVFYMLIFPTGFFFAQVYTEGLFVGCAFASLALMRRKQYVLAAILAGFAVVTRAVGIALAFALIVQLLVDGVEASGWQWSKRSLPPLPKQAALKGVLLALIPAGFYLIWWSQLGAGFTFVEKYFFGSTTFGIVPALFAWLEVLPSVWGETTSWSGNLAQTSVYFSLEFCAIVMALIACWKMRFIAPAVAVFSVLAWSIAFFNGSPHSMVRYVAVMPALYLWLGQLGIRPNFDRIWTIVSLLLFGLLATLFSFDFWVA